MFPPFLVTYIVSVVCYFSAVFILVANVLPCCGDLNSGFLSCCHFL